jgi:hypothetical protein
MKKTYISPQTEYLMPDEQEMICTSLLFDGDAQSAGIDEADSRILDFAVSGKDIFEWK